MTICGARCTDGHMCGRSAGRGTDHPGTGRCFAHDGGRQLYQGASKLLAIVAADPELNFLAQAYLEDPDILNVRAELAVLRARFTKIQQKPDDSDVLLLSRLAETISKIALRIQEMEIGRKHYLHISITANLVAAFAQIGQEFFPDRIQRERFLAAIEEHVRKNLRRNTARQIAASALIPDLIPDFGSNFSELLSVADTDPTLAAPLDRSPDPPPDPTPNPTSELSSSSSNQPGSLDGGE